ncbi:MAG: ABC-F family ATP-binding cassette domain-containing protein [Bacillota bacterium]|nr:ABC-F family ATP-binding cassette domain-containing protein [Bacillota bacterium]
MNLLTIEGITKSYGEKTLLNKIDLGINEGDRIGLIGINGTGKSTLLKIIAGLEPPNGGKLIKANTVRIEYLPQNPAFDPQATVLEQVFKGESSIMKLIRTYEEAIINESTPNEKILKLTNEMDLLNAWSVENEAKSILTKLGISNFKAPVGSLSGGQQKRIALAAALVNPSELLILDEPTNHLDNDTIEWLEQYLNKRKGSLLMITHDRYFLDRVANRIIELDRGSLYSYKGNYSHFLEAKLARQEIEAATEEKRQNLLRNELAWIRRGARARTTKQKARVDRFNKLVEENSSRTEEKLEISVGVSRLGKKVVELEQVSKSFGQYKIIDGFSYIVQRDDRIGIVGPNGSGKSTLLNIVAGRLQPDKGLVDIGETVRIGLYSQDTQHIDDNLRVIEYIKEGAEYLTTASGDKISASQMLERFLFSPEMQWTYVGKLSGGEKRRLYLLRILMDAPNVLLLDEPTNDLDVTTLAILEDYLEGFKGAVLAVSHDRYFLDRMADKILAFAGQGQIVKYTGNYSDYRESVSPSEVESASTAFNKQEKPKVVNPSAEKPKERPLKFSFAEQKEYGEIDQVIAQLEGKLEQLSASINEAATDYNLLQQLSIEKEELEKQLEEKMDRWVYLNDLAEKIAADKHS